MTPVEEAVRLITQAQAGEVQRQELECAAAAVAVVGAVAVVVAVVAAKSWMDTRAQFEPQQVRMTLASKCLGLE